MGSWMPSVFGPATWVLICLAPLGMARPIQAEELSPRIVLDLKERQIRFVSEQGNLGPWPVAIGDPSTPTPKGRFRILDKQIDPIYLSTKNGDPQELSGPLARLEIATWRFSATSAVNSGYMAHHGPIESRTVLRSARVVCAC